MLDRASNPKSLNKMAKNRLMLDRGSNPKSLNEMTKNRLMLDRGSNPEFKQDGQNRLMLDRARLTLILINYIIFFFRNSKFQTWVYLINQC